MWTHIRQWSQILRSSRGKNAMPKKITIIMVALASKKSAVILVILAGKTFPATSGCEECEKEHAEWVALRLCLSCGHVGCCDSSKGIHATKHFVNTAHPVIVALPNKLWKWCYVDKIYG